jgi:pimeloyl-ACP methyl ester carboxylesterase
MGRQLAPRHRYLPWHGTQPWRDLLAVYDRMAREYFGYCKSALVDTEYGATQSYACGDPGNPPVLFLHGAGSNALIYGPWLVPDLASTHYCLVVDYPCDVGRSLPPDGDPGRCPGTEAEIAAWVDQVLVELLPPAGDGSQRPAASMVGYSYGAAVATFVAIHKSHLVDRLVLLAPAALLDELSTGFYWYAMIFALFRSDWSQNYFLKWVSAPNNANKEYSLSTVPRHERDQLVAIREVAGTVLSVPSPVLDDAALRAVFGAHRTLVGVGEHERLLRNASGTASVRALANGAAMIRVYPDAGHLMLVEAGSSVARDVVAFLNDDPRSGGAWARMPPDHVGNRI